MRGLDSRITFSIITPTYNREKMLHRAINSVLAQSNAGWEMVIVDDGSTDGTRSMVNALDDPRIRYLYQEHQERSVARNLGVRESRGDYLLFLDSDDAFTPGHLACLAEGLAGYPEVAMLRTQFQVRREHGSQDRRVHLNVHPVIEVWKSFIPLNSWCFHRPLFEHNAFAEHLWLWEDKHFLLRLLLDIEPVVLDCCTAVVYDHPARSVHVVDDETFVDKLQQVPKAIEDLWKTHGDRLSEYISDKDIRKTHFALAYGYANDALGADQPELARVALRKAWNNITVADFPRWLLAYSRTL